MEGRGSYRVSVCRGEASHVGVRRGKAWYGMVNFKDRKDIHFMVAKLKALEPVSNDAEEHIQSEQPYSVILSLIGSCPILFHKWSCEDVAEKAAAKKNSKTKKTDNLESYIYRNEQNQVCLPGEYVRQAICHAAKFRQDPRSPRKSAFDLFKAGIVVLEELLPINRGAESWDYVDQRRVTIQRNGITRQRPAFNKGWVCEAHIGVVLPEYIDSQLLQDVATLAGKVIGCADNRPSYGRFQITKFEVLQDLAE